MDGLFLLREKLSIKGFSLRDGASHLFITYWLFF